MALKTNVLTVGVNTGLVKALDAHEGSYNLYLVEEPDLWRKRKLYDLGLDKLRSLRGTRFVEYQQSEASVDRIVEVAREVDADAIVPGLEYAVLPATMAAARLGLPNVGESAAFALTNKLILRSRLAEANVPVPRFQRVHDVTDVQQFFDGPIILKPANRQASTGVVRITRYEEIAWAWHITRSATEGAQVADRHMNWIYMVEDLMYGPEVSTEVIVRNGEVQFFNVTQKSTAAGSFPVEIGHYLPADLSISLLNQLHDGMRSLIACLGVQNGVLHGEWILSSEGPRLVECAGRPPGDRIFVLIEAAYGFSPYVAVVDTLAGNPTKYPLEAPLGAAIVFVYGKPGRVVNTTDLKELLDNPKVIGADVTVKPGELLEELRNSWNRAGYVMAKDSSGKAAWSEAEAQAQRLKIEAK